MEYATGESLEDVVRRHPAGLPVEDAVEWMQGIAAGVAYLHDHGIVHRDLKPGNIFLDDGQVKLGDYGLSKFISCSRRSGQTESIGTVHYMAPEVANGRYGKEIDIYALGIILYEMLTGRVPFEGESVGEVLMKHLTAEPSLAEVPAAYREVIGRALAKDPTRRFTSVAEMVSHLPPLAATMAYGVPLPKTFQPSPSPPPAVDPSEPSPQPVAAAPSDSPPRPDTPPRSDAAWQAPPVPPLDAAAPLAASVFLADEEPIWRAIRDGWRTTRDSWDRFNTPTKVGLAVLGIVVITNPNTWSFALNYGPPLVFLYVLYRIGRSVVRYQERRRALESGLPTDSSAARSEGAPRWSPPPREARAAAPLVPPGPADIQATAYQPSGPWPAPTDWRKASAKHWKKSSRRWRPKSTPALVVKTPRERLADLAGSMMLSAAIGALMSLVVVLLQGGGIAKEQYAWLTITSVAATWAVLVPAKFWEGTNGDAVMRRLTMMVLGMAVGGAAYLAATTLIATPDIPHAGLPNSPRFHINGVGHFSSQFYDANGTPQIYAYLVYFGALFVVFRWWKQADPLRRTRLSVWGTGVCVFMAWLVDAVWAFPQPWGLLVAAITSISVQLSSPYLPDDQRVAGQTAEGAGE